MIRRVDITDERWQFGIGLLLHLLFLAVLWLSPLARYNIQLPEGNAQHNLWRGSDVLSYVQPARNFLQHGVIGRGLQPGFLRTAGYPLFLAGLMRLFGSRWLTAAWLLQALLFAFFYPLLTRFVRLLLGDNRTLIRRVFLFSLLSAAYWARIPLILSDTFFALSFYIGLFLGIRALVRQSWPDALGQLFFLGYAAQVRPSLLLYPVVHFMVFIAVLQAKNLRWNVKRRQIAALSLVLLNALVLLPSARNYVNYGVFKPTGILENNMLHFLGRQVLEDRGRLAEYEAMDRRLQEVPDFREEMALEKTFALQIYERYPLTTLKCMFMPNLAATLFGNNWTQVFNYWNRHWRDKPLKNRLPLKKFLAARVIFVFMFFVYLLIYLSFVLYLWKLLRRKRYAIVFTLLAFFAYFLLPTVLAGVVRLRLPVEGFFVIFGLRYWELKI